ncbi:DNA-binding transcriptional regulator, FadR family [Thermomonospora echinospora]|uniref:DNA-binding transcriptional regulator, FadR family n=1 Tax=Thermomonospora echinospora TaxID=1992 RepID=A0A1H5U0X8_9ACTN|nr:GntR family transcriptional regulator [Thermomonospora echinospora]SEF67911.1 DNA-binding transcriptional regulator, FadR family [Thermomonospora echinospora]
MTDTTDASGRSGGIPIVYRPGIAQHAADSGNGQAASRSPKASEVTAAAIVHHIVEAGLRVGDRLPSEADMLAHYNVSRETLREALRLLEVQGLISIKRGPGGGPLVEPLNAKYLARTATLYFRLSGATYDELFDTWETIEPPLAARVARLRDRRLKARAFAPFLDYRPEEHERDEVFRDLNNFHAVIAALSGNRVLTLLTQAVTHIATDHVVEKIDPIEESDHMLHSHRDIAEAIIAGHSKRAATLMQQHIAAVTHSYRERWPERMSKPIEWY